MPPSMRHARLCSMAFGEGYDIKADWSPDHRVRKIDASTNIIDTVGWKGPGIRWRRRTRYQRAAEPFPRRSRSTPARQPLYRGSGPTGESEWLSTNGTISTIAGTNTAFGWAMADLLTTRW